LLLHLAQRDDKCKHCWTFLGYLKNYWLVKNGCAACCSYDSKDHLYMFKQHKYFYKIMVVTGADRVVRENCACSILVEILKEGALWKKNGL